MFFSLSDKVRGQGSSLKVMGQVTNINVTIRNKVREKVTKVKVKDQV